MRKYDFESVIERKGMDALAVDMLPYEGVQVREGFSAIPMWVADMNFNTVPTVAESMTERAKHMLYGYFLPRKEYYDRIMKWQNTRFGVEGLCQEYIGYENGVLGGVVSALNVLCSRGDSVLIHSPIYIGFTGSLENSGYHIVQSPLIRDAENVWRMDYGDMEEKIKSHHIHAAVFCSPHNPTGRVWEREEISRMLELFQKYDVYVISDEIWSDIILRGNRHIPTQTVSEDARMRTIALYAPSKTFNLAGLVGAYHVIYNTTLRDRMDKESSISHYNSMNLMSMYALIGAYQPQGYEWTEELCGVITENVEYACGYIRDHFDGIKVSKPQGTYMLFLDCREWCERNNKSLDDLLHSGVEVGVIWQDGRPFHMEYGIRMNLALPATLLREAFERLSKYVFENRA